MKKYIGAHVSAAGGVDKAVDNALEINAKAFAIFVKNQRRWNAPPLDQQTINLFKSKLQKSGIPENMVLPHAGYLINLGNPDPNKRERSVKSLIDEMYRCSQLGLKRLNIHPGSHLRQITEQKSLDLITDNIEQAFSEIQTVGIVLETTAGQGTNLGYNFEQIGYIINKIRDKKRISACLDTCHSFSAGYSFNDPEGYKSTLNEFEKNIGFNYLSAVHLNDSKFDYGEKKDRHENIGRGYLSIEFFKRFMNDPHFDNIPIILETKDSKMWKAEIEMLYNMIKVPTKSS
ncbi:MAG: deoxyribonuclease IV [Victivallales bacterium]|nr:deoxyribonuclease IV [Victivallales bacterium]MCF7888666.1 deoxyribonuclease IV [Victivallales bacterium]